MYETKFRLGLTIRLVLIKILTILPCNIQKIGKIDKNLKYSEYDKNNVNSGSW